MPMSKSKSGKLKKHKTMGAAKKRAKKDWWQSLVSS